jgi:glycosyltransferase involved in cell wall biosynthesis
LQEVIEDGVNGHLVDFFDQAAWVETLEEVLAEPERQVPIRHRARQTIVETYDLRSHCLPRQLALVDQVAGLSC